MRTACVYGVLLVAGSVAASSQSRAPSAAVVYEGGRLIAGDGRAPIENGAFVVEDGRITALGPRGGVPVPAGARRVDLTGKTVMPAMVNVHVHIGYEGYTTWGADNYTPSNVLDHLEREAFYGVGATQSVGSSPTEQALQFQQDQQAGKFPSASRFFFMPGMAPPGGGPDAILIKATTALHVVNEVSTAPEARAAVQAMAARNIRSVKIWVDDRRGTYPKMTPEVYNAVIDEAHKHQMLVHAHATTLADQKAVVRAGVDVLVHIVGNAPVDDEFLALLREKKPYWTPVMGFGDRSEVCDNDPFVDQAYPTKVLARIREESCGPRSAAAVAREEILATNFPRDDYRGRAPRSWHGCRHRCPSYVRLGRPPRDRALGAAWTVAVAGDCCGDRNAGGTAGDQGHGDAGRRQERRFRRPERKPARQHPRHATNRRTCTCVGPR